MATKYTFNFTDATKDGFDVQSYTANGIKVPTSPVLLDRAAQANTTLKIYGKGLKDYGEGVFQDLIYMLENFANPARPEFTIEGQLWYNNSTEELFIRNADVDDSFTAGSPLNPLSHPGWDGVILATGTTPMFGELTLAGNPTDPLHAISLGDLTDHENDVAGTQYHLTPTQNTFMDGLLIGGSPASLQADDVNALIGISGNVQTQLDNKLSLSGGTMDAGLSPPANITFQGGEVLGLPAVPSAADAAASKQYVDDQITSGTGELTAIAWIPSTVSPPPTIDVNENTAVFTVTSPSTSYNLYLEGVSRDGHTHAAIDVVLDNSFNTAYPTNLQASTEYVEGELESIKQQIGTGQPVEVTLNIERKFELLSSTIVAGSPYQVLPHTVDDNNLSITINGIKQYNHSRASQNIVFKSGILSSFVTGLDDTLDYDFNINVDGAGATLITITAGTTVTTFDDLITAINNAMNVGSPPLLNNVVASVTIDGVITFITDSSGSGSTISITDPSTANDYLFDIDASPDAINSAVFVSDTSQVIGSPPGSPATLPTPDTIEILGDVSATFTVGRAFAIFGSSDPTYGTFDGTYSVHVNGPVVGGSPLTTSIPIAQLGAPNTNVPLLGAYNPAGSPTPPAPSPSAYGDVYITPLVNIDYVDTAVSGLSGDYTETDAAGNDVRAGELTSYVVFNYDILSGSRIETLKYS